MGLISIIVEISFVWPEPIMLLFSLWKFRAIISITCTHSSEVFVCMGAAGSEIKAYNVFWTHFKDHIKGKCT